MPISEEESDSAALACRLLFWSLLCAFFTINSIVAILSALTVWYLYEARATFGGKPIYLVHFILCSIPSLALSFWQGPADPARTVLQITLAPCVSLMILVCAILWLRTLGKDWIKEHLKRLYRLTLWGYFPLLTMATWALVIPRDKSSNHVGFYFFGAPVHETGWRLIFLVGATIAVSIAYLVAVAYFAETATRLREAWLDFPRAERYRARERARNSNAAGQSGQDPTPQAERF
jgi:hypothetical protein